LKGKRGFLELKDYTQIKLIAIVLSCISFNKLTAPLIEQTDEDLKSSLITKNVINPLSTVLYLFRL